MFDEDTIDGTRATIKSVSLNGAIIGLVELRRGEVR